jgi:hypothetical protein
MKKGGTADEYSFYLKPSEHGVGVFAACYISKGAYLRLFGDGEHVENRSRFLRKIDVPKIFQEYCMDRGSKLVCPGDFGVMPIGWYLNHSLSPNAHHIDYKWYASCDIEAGEEVLIDYNTLEEPEDSRNAYYKGK